jgi:hypothetical protein
VSKLTRPLSVDTLEMPFTSLLSPNCHFAGGRMTSKNRAARNLWEWIRTMTVCALAGAIIVAHSIWRPQGVAWVDTLFGILGAAMSVASLVQLGRNVQILLQLHAVKKARYSASDPFVAVTVREERRRKLEAAQLKLKSLSEFHYHFEMTEADQITFGVYGTLAQHLDLPPSRSR